MKRLSIFSLAALLALAPARAAIPSGMAEVVLDVGDLTGYGTVGFQWILDSTHSTFGEFFYPGAMMYFGDYSAFDHTVPEGAEPRYSTGGFVVNDKVSAYVPAGIYDWMVIQPDPEGLWYALGDMTRVNDFTLLEGESYRMTFEENTGSEGPGYYATLHVATDLAVTAVTLPRASTDLTNSETISVTLANNGTTDITGFAISYTINGGIPVSEIFNDVLKAGDSAEYTFSTPADLSGKGSYIVTVTVDTDRDMIASNNSMQGKTRNLTPVDTPYNLVFSDISEEDFPEEWYIINNTQEGGWGYSSWKMNKTGEMGAAFCQSGYTIGGDDWMISRPINLHEGKAHVLFSVCSANEEQTEYLEVYTGRTLDPASMTLAAEYALTSAEWSDKAINFDVPEDGIYYVAFHGISPATAYSFSIGDVTVDEGEFIGSPMIKCERLLLPYSNCDLPSDARIGMRISNKGTGAMTSYTLTAYVNDREEMTIFDTPVMPDETADIYLDKTFDLSAPGLYEVQLLLSGDPDTVISRETTVECFSPLTEFPIVSNFTHDFNTDIWQAMTPGSWEYEPMFEVFSSTASGFDNGLLSRGATLSHPARFKISYMAPGWEVGAMAVYMGPSSADPSTYTRVYVDNEIYSDAKEAEFTAPITAPGNYSFIIADEAPADSRNRLRLNQVDISEVHPHDLSLISAEGSLAPYTPAKAVEGNHSYTVNVTNRGSEPMSGIKAYATLDGVKISESSTPITLAPEASGEIPLIITLPEKKSGDTFTLAFSVAANETDDFPADNSLSLEPFTVTDSTFAHETLTDLTYGTGVSGDTLSIGYVYTLPQMADVTGMTVGLANADDETLPNVKADIAFSIYRLTPDGDIERRLWSETRTRGMGGLIDVDFQDMRLDAGDYYFEVAQLSPYNMGIAQDVDIVTTCMQREGDKLTPMPSYAVCIRAEFAPGAEVYAKDAAATLFTAPTYTEGLYDAATTVKAIARNAGYEKADFKVELTLDGSKVGESSVSLLPYDETEVSFDNVDFSKAGLHTLTATAIMAADENMANNSTHLTIDAHAEADPYLMDFENCFDFDATGDPWNPRWTTIDRNGITTDIFWRYQHPHQGEPVGFMAFNIAATIPSMVEVPLQGFYPHAGERFGVAFHFNPWSDGAENVEESDVWIISPELQLGDNSEFELYVKTRMLEGDYAQLEPYRVLISETDTEPASFTILGDTERLAAVEDWEKVTVDLSDYDNKSVYVALQYIGRPHANTCLMIDDLHVKTKLPDNAVAAVADEMPVRVIGNSISAPAGSRVYTTDGMECGTEDLAPGIYIVKTPTLTTKVIIR